MAIPARILGLFTQPIAPRHWRYLAGALLVASTLPFIGSAVNGIDGDVWVYHRAAEALFRGQLYREVVFEYPPYMLLWVLVPGAVSLEPLTFRVVFALQMLCLDALLKWLLLREGRRSFPDARALLPFLVVLLDGVLQEYLYLKRFDLVPATLSVLVALWAGRGRMLAAGAGLAIATATKLYPALFLPVVGALALRRGALGRYVAGLAAGSLPLAALAWAFPWWKFATFHLDRGLQVESLYASLLWAARGSLGALDWRHNTAAFELVGPAADAVMPYAKVLFLAAVLAAVGAASFAALKERAPGPGRVAELMLGPVVAFVAFNTVLSPQFHIWLVGLAALALVDRRWLPAAVVVATTALIPLFFPSPSYAEGLDPFRTGVLIARNLGLVALAGVLGYRMLRDAPDGVALSLLIARSWTTGRAIPARPNGPRS